MGRRCPGMEDKKMNVKLLMITGLVLAQGAMAETKTTVIQDTTRAMKVQLNQQTVLCSAADYGAMFLKILIPDLAEVTVLDHRNIGAGAPCVAAGMCRTDNMPADILDVDRPSEVVPVRVVLTKTATLNKDVCTIRLVETLEIPIRGKVFTHRRSINVGKRNAEDCR